MSTMAKSDIGPIGTLQTFDLRNGDVSTAVSLLTKAAIAVGYRWRPITNLPNTSAIKHTDVFVKLAYRDLRANVATTMTDVVVRKMAIALGVARATMTELYRLTPADLITGETNDAIITYVPPVAPATEPTWTFAQGVTEADQATLCADFEFTDTERGVMSDLLLCSVGIPAIQGASLMACGHHYLSDAGEKSRPFYEVIEKQFWKKDPTKTWVADCIADIQDIMWHKAGHPINIAVKLKCAVDPNIAEKIRRTGSGSSASRLPAREANLKAADTALTLLTNVRPFYENYGGSMDTVLLENAILLAGAYMPMIGGDATGGNAMPGVDPKDYITEDTPTYVKDRATALEFVDNIMKRNTDKIAMAFGFYEALCESAAMGAASTEDQTLLGANSLKKLKSQASAAYYMGRETYGDYKAFKAAQRTASKYLPNKTILT